MSDTSRTDSPDQFHQVVIDGVAFDAATEQEVVDRVFRDLRHGAGGLILTVNTDILRQLPAQGGLERQARLVVADGMPLVWASRILGDPLPARVTGASLVPVLSARAATEKRSVFLFGAAPGVAERAAENLRRDAPGLEVVGAYSPPLGFDKDEATLQEAIHTVATARPDIVFVALGFPRQEQVALRMQNELPGTWFVGCGGALDMAAGDVPRAHGLVQRLGAEWLHRLSQEPMRLGRRYLVDGVPFTLGMLGRSGLQRATRARRR